MAPFAPGSLMKTRRDLATRPLRYNATLSDLSRIDGAEEEVLCVRSHAHSLNSLRKSSCDTRRLKPVKAETIDVSRRSRRRALRNYYRPPERLNFTRENETNSARVTDSPLSGPDENSATETFLQGTYSQIKTILRQCSYIVKLYKMKVVKRYLDNY